MRYLAFSLLLLTACASSSDSDTSLLSSSTEHGSTTDFDLSLEQTNVPIQIGSQSTLDFRYAIEVRNQSASPVTLKRISLSSVSSAPVVIGTTTRAFNETLAPGESRTVEFWATALIEDFTRGARLPVTLRIRPTFNDGSGKDRSETFTRRVAAKYGVELGR